MYLQLKEGFEWTEVVKGFTVPDPLAVVYVDADTHQEAKGILAKRFGVDYSWVLERFSVYNKNTPDWYYAHVDKEQWCRLVLLLRRPDEERGYFSLKAIQNHSIPDLIRRKNE